MRWLLLCVAGGHRHSCTSLGLQDHGLLVEASCRPLSLLGCTAIRQISLTSTKEPLWPPPLLHFSLALFLGEILGPGHALAAGREEEHWWALQVSCQSSHSSTCSCLTLKGVIFFIIHMAVSFSHVFLLGLGFWFCFFFFFLKGEKQEKSEFARYV